LNPIHNSIRNDTDWVSTRVVQNCGWGIAHQYTVIVLVL
jgi:hypothetical protein